MGLMNQSKGTGESNLPPTETNEGIPTYGYDAVNGEAKLFSLKQGEGLPKGYVNSPAKAKNFKG